MVSGISDEERERFAAKIKAGFVLLVGLSAGLITLQGEVGALVSLGATAIGLVFGALLVWLVFPDPDEFKRGDRSRSRRRR